MIASLGLTCDGMPRVTEHWFATRDGDPAALDLYERHYSAYRYRDGRVRKLFIGPGEKLVLLTYACDALFAWRKFIDDSGQVGVNCSVFRNESSHRASDLILEAERVAWARWPGERLYTFVNSVAVRRSRQPGRCFLKAGWHYDGQTKGGLLILAKGAAS